MQFPARTVDRPSLSAGRRRWAAWAIGRLLLVWCASGLLGLAWWDWLDPLIGRPVPLSGLRLLGMLAVAGAPGLALWVLASRVTYPFWLALPASLFFLRYLWPSLPPTWNPLGVQPGSRVWVYGLVMVTSAVAGLSLARLGRAWGVGAFLRRHAWRLVLGGTACYVLVFGLLALARHDGFRSHALDLGAMDQTAWNTAQGRFFEHTPLYRHPADGTRTESRLLDAKLELVFLPLAALYRLWPDPRLLLILQAALLGAGAVPLYLIARREMGPGGGAVLPALGYLCYLPLHYVNLADFHPSALMIPLLFAAWYAQRAGRWRWYYACLALALCCRVDAAFLMLGLGVAVALRPGPARRHGLITLTLGAAWLLIDFGLVVPAVRRATGAGANDLVQRRFGGGPLEILGALLTRPWAVLAPLLDRERLQALGDLLAPVGFVSLLGPLGLLPALPVLLINLLARSEWQHSIYAHYAAPAIPFIWIAAVQGTAWLARLSAPSEKALASEDARSSVEGEDARSSVEGEDARSPMKGEDAPSSVPVEEGAQSQMRRLPGGRGWIGEVAGALPLFILLNTLLVTWLFSPYPLGRAFSLADVYQPSSYEANLRAVLAFVPEDASVCAQSDLHPHLSQRRDVALLPFCRLSEEEEAAYVVLDLDPTAEKSPLDTHAFYELVGAWLSRPEYGVVAQQGGALLLQRGAPRDSIAAVQEAIDDYGREFYRVSWIETNAPDHLSAAVFYRLPLAAGNEGSQIWHSQGQLPVRVTYRWFDENGAPVDVTALRTDLPHRVAPGHTVRLRAALLTPPTPGSYTLEWHMLREGDAWFQDRGGAVQRQQVTID